MKQIDIRKTAEDSLAIYKGQFRYWSEKFILAIEKTMKQELGKRMRG